jgi:hypothetical protein
MFTADLFPAELAAAQREIAAAAPYEPVHCVLEDEFFDDVKFEEEPREPVMNPQTGYLE